MIRLAGMIILAAALHVSTASSGAEPRPMTFDQALEQLKTYDYGQSDKPLRAIELHIVRFATDAARKAEVAGRLAAILADPKTPRGATVFVCQQLVAVGTEAQVPLLTKMLDDPQTVEIARYTLEAIPGDASVAAIRSSLDHLRGMALVGAVNSLGIRRDQKAVVPLTKLLNQTDPQVAAAAAESLGKIATSEAAVALLKAEVRPRVLASLHNAQIQCAERLAAAGESDAATSTYERIWASKRPAAWRVAGLAGLARTAKEKAAPLVLDALGSDDPFLQAAAVRLSAGLPGQQVTKALIERLERLDPTSQVLLLDVLAERGDRSAAAAVVRHIEDKEESVRIAAARAMGSLGDASKIEPLARLAADSTAALQQAARGSMARLSGADIEPKLLSIAGEGVSAVRIEAIRAVAARRSKEAAPVLLKAATDADPSVRAAAWDSLAVVVDPGSLPAMVQLLVSAVNGADAEAAERAVLVAGKRIEDPGQRAHPVIAALVDAPAAAKPRLLRLLSGLGGPQALEAVLARIHDQDAAVREAVVKALANWPDAAAADDLLRIAQTSDSTAHKMLAVRGYLRLAGEIAEATQRLKALERVRPIAKTTEFKRMLLAVLSDVPDAGALHVAASFLQDTDVRAEAEAATLRIARALVRLDPPAVRAAMKRIMDTTKDQTVADQAASVDEEANKAPSPGAAAQALLYDKKRSDLQKTALGKRPPKGFRLACYLDCGPDTADGVKGGPLLRVVNGGPYFWPESDQVADARFGSVFFDGPQVVFEATGLNPKRSYQIGFTWWDFDHGTREQSVWLATGKGQSETKVLSKSRLPSAPSNQAPEGKTLPVPPGLYGDGSLRISFRNEGQPNAVVSELWLWESGAEPAASGQATPAGVR